MQQNRLNLSEAIRHWGTYYKDKIAISGERQLTYYKLNKIIDYLSNKVIARINKPRQRIVILTNKKIEFIIFLTSIIRTNNIFILINPTLDNNNIIQLIKDSKADLIITDNEFSDLANFFNTITFDFIDLKLNNIKAIKYKIPSINDIAGIFFSSGTTGKPKGIVRTHYSIFSEAILWMVELQLNKESCFFITRPLYYTGGFVLFYSTLFFGGNLVLFNNMKNQDLVYYENKNINWTFLNPYQIAELTNFNIGIVPNYLTKNILTMGAPLSTKIKIDFTKKYKCNLIESWGNTEGLGTITDSQDIYTRPDSIGRNFFTDEIIVIDKEHKELSCNNNGYFAGYTDNSFLHYENNKEATLKHKNNSLIISDDIGFKDSDGYFYYLNRENDVIYKNNKKIFPKEIEKIIYSFQIVKDCIVIFNDTTKTIHAFIELNETINKEDLLIKINNALDTDSQLSSLVILDKIPRNSGGKVIKNDLLNKL